MSTQSLTTIWHQALAQLAQRLDDPSIEAWLADTHPVRMDRDTLVVEFPNVFTRDWVEARYARILEDLLRDLAGYPLRLSFALPGDGHKPIAGAGSSFGRTGSLWPSSAPSAAGSPAPVLKPVHRPRPPRPNLKPRYTFETFVVGDGNRFPHAAALAVAEAPARAYNPLFLYGGVGLGKTHLMQAIGHRVLEHSPDAYVMYISSETFTNELIDAITRKAMAEFRNRYRNVDVLLIDDIHFVAGKESTQEEFFHTFNALYEANKQIVISSDRPPKDIPTLEERLRSRFEWGLTADLQMPDLETRIAILRKKAETEHLSVPGDVLSFIAERVSSNIRELEGALIRVVAFASIHGGRVTLDLAAEALKDLAPVSNPPITIATIQKVVADYFKLPEAEMRAKKRNQAVAFPRQLAMYLARELTDASLPRIGQEFGGRDHSTVLHACEKIRSRLEKEPDLMDLVRVLKRKIQEQNR